MSEIPSECRYIATHQWARLEADGLVTVGITDYAQKMLGDVVFVELPEEGDDVVQEQDVAVAESVKSASDVYAPVSGVVVAINEDLEDAPELVNDDPYGDGWLFQVRVEGDDPMAGLMDADAYRELLAGDA